MRYGAPIDPGAYGVRRKQELIDEVRRRIAELAGLDVGGGGGEQGSGPPGEEDEAATD